MPTKDTLTKLRVKQRKRKCLSKNVKRKTRAVKSMRKHRKSVKKVMRGGADPIGLGFVLYDDIPLNTSENNPYIIPICMFFIRKMIFSKDDVYIFFNKYVTGPEITLIVKHYLGIDEGSDFSIDPPITIPDITSDSAPTINENKRYENLWGFLGNTFVKLSGGTRLETGVFEQDKPLFDIRTNQHTMTSNSKPVEIRPRKRDEITSFLRGDFIKNKIRESVQPGLFKDYIHKLKELKLIRWNDHIAKEHNYGEERRLDTFMFSRAYKDDMTPKYFINNIEYGLFYTNGYAFHQPLQLLIKN